MKLNRILAVCLMASALIITSCKKDDDDNGGGNTPETGTLAINFEHNFNGNHFHLFSKLVTDNDDSLTFTTFKYYVSNIVLVNAKNEEYKVPDSYYLIDASKNYNIITLKDVPKGDYKAFKFLIGVDSAHNVSGDKTGALDPINGMFWSWTTGYRFMMVEGKTNQSPNGLFVFHIGGFKTGANAIREVKMESASDAAYVKAAAAPEIHIAVDIAEFFKNPETIDISATNDVQMPGAMAVMLATNYADMFSLEHIHN